MGTGCTEDSFLGTGQTVYKQPGWQLHRENPGFASGLFSLDQGKLPAWRRQQAKLPSPQGQFCWKT